MANPEAVLFCESLLQRTDQQVRQILAVQDKVVEVDTINMLMGNGITTLVAGVAGAVRADFNGRITGGFIHEFDGVTGSATIGIDKAQYAIGVTPTFVSIVGSAPLSISSARYSENILLNGWNDYINRGDVLRFSITSVTAFTRLLVTLRVRRLEP